MLSCLYHGRAVFDEYQLIARVVMLGSGRPLLATTGTEDGR